jgi:hypothetical protein
VDLRDITNEFSLLKSYKTAYVDNQGYELVKSYRDHHGKFPIFTERVFTSSGRSPVDLLDYKVRDSVDDQNIGRMFVLERMDNSGDVSKTRLFFVWVSPKLIARFKDTPANSLQVSANVLFHPFGGIATYPAYWKGDIEPVKIPNYLELEVRYLFREKNSVLQHLCAVRPGPIAGQSTSLQDKDSQLDVMLVVPVSSSAAFMNLSNSVELEDALREIARRCYEGITAKILAGGSPAIQRVAVSAYSRSGALLQALFADMRTNEPFMRGKLKEAYAFDVMLDERDKNKKVVKTKQQGYDELWGKLKTWQGEDSDKRIRLYSAEPGTVANVYAELQSRLKQYGGGYHNPAVKFSDFNNTKTPDGSTKYSGMSNGYEIYSTDNSRALVVLPSGNFLIYLSTENIKNDGGFQPGGDYEPNLEGHSWFVSRLMSHALYHSGF